MLFGRRSEGDRDCCAPTIPQAEAKTLTISLSLPDVHMTQKACAGLRFRV